ncbi:hypothetical protein ACN38_g333 [Penicillium nordicum]|uniref:Uncharacterized protein n=1 Tax=Penicillium nordicum TaxID=229535 RepID=A0A0M8PHC0_9EURO|nr:hypothetical protein ACN38_g333 [Penicillium nordicum]
MVANRIKSYIDSLYKVDWMDGALSLDLTLEILVSPGGRYEVSRGDGENHDCAWSFEGKSWSFYLALALEY